MVRCRTNPDKENHQTDLNLWLSTDRAIFLHSLEGPVLLPLDADIEPLPAPVEIFSHLSDGGSVGLGDVADVGKLHPDNHFLNNKNTSNVKMSTWI